MPNNWREFEDNNTVTFAPVGAFGNYQGQAIFTHGAIVGVVDAQSRNLRQASDRYISTLLQSNQYLRPLTDYRRERIDGRPALEITLGGRSNVTERDETVTVYTALLRNGNLFYLIGVAPRDQYQAYDQAFDRMLRSVDIFG